MSKEFLKRLEKLPKLSSSRTKKVYDLPVDYVVSKFYELGYRVTHNKFNNTYNSCCPLCREGSSWGKKKRCFYIPETNNIYCHNCGSSMRPYNWILATSGMTEDELQKDIADNVTTVDINFEEPAPYRKIPSLPDDSINLFDPTQVEFYKNDHIVQTVLAYIRGRRLDTAVNRPDAFYLSLTDYVHRYRLVIPFKNTEGKIIHYQSRRVFEWDEKPDYLTKVNSDKSLFGVDKIDPTQDDVFIFEGPLDSCFVKNSVAVAGINEGHHRFTSIQADQLDELRLFNKIWVLDNQWIDNAAREKSRVLLEQGECVFVWPEKFKNFKDFNDICKYCNLDEIKRGFIKKNSTCGKGAVLKFNVVFGKLS